MSGGDFADAFLDSTYLKLDEGALAFIFTRQRVEKASQLTTAEAAALVATHRDELVRLYAGTARRILKDAFYMQLYEELAELDDELAFAFINLCLRRVEDETIEAARRDVVVKIAASRKKAPRNEPEAEKH